MTMESGPSELQPSPALAPPAQLEEAPDAMAELDSGEKHPFGISVFFGVFAAAMYYNIDEGAAKKLGWPYFVVFGIEAAVFTFVLLLGFKFKLWKVTGTLVVLIIVLHLVAVPVFDLKLTHFDNS